MSIFSSLRYCHGDPRDHANIYAALAFIPFGLFFDFMDGKVARWRNKASLMGQELDSLADLVSVLPAPCCSAPYGPRSTDAPRSPLVSLRLHVPFRLVFERLSIISSSQSSCSAAWRDWRASTSPFSMSRKTRLASRNTSKAYRSLCLSPSSVSCHTGYRKVGRWSIYHWELRCKDLRSSFTLLS